MDEKSRKLNRRYLVQLLKICGNYSRADIAH